LDAPCFGSWLREKAFQLPGSDPQRLGVLVGPAHKDAAFYKGCDEHREIAGLGLFDSAGAISTQLSDLELAVKENKNPFLIYHYSQLEYEIIQIALR